MSDEPRQIERKRAKITASAPPPRIVHYVHTRQEVEEEEDDEPVLRKPKRSPMASLIIFMFVGAVVGFVMMFGGTFILSISNQRPDHVGSGNDFPLTIFASLCWSVPAFVLGGCIGAFLWAVTKPKR